VHVHSIIAVKGNGPLEKEDDGVVAYKSAYIEGAESTLHASTVEDRNAK
jgi:hypothetical protein